MNAKTTAAIEKLPPQNIEAEKSVLGALMLDKNGIVRVADFLEAKDFYKKDHQAVYGVITDLFTKGEPIDLLAVATRLKEKKLLDQIGGNSYLTELINFVPTATHVASYAKTVQRKRILRDLIEVSHDINVMGYNEEEDVDVLLDKAEQRIFSIAQHSLTQNFVPVKATLEEAFERIDRLSKERGIPRGIPTGFIDLDNILAGFQKSDLIILAARPSIGKSTLALNVASHIAVNAKLPVGIFSLEMSRDQVVDRLIATYAHIDLWKLRTGRLSSEGENNDFDRIQHAMGILSEAPIYIDDSASSNILQMRAMARRLQAQEGLGLIVVDYLQLMEPRDANIGIVQQITEISRALKGLARELNIPVLALSQLSRAVEQRSPQIPRLADLRDSGCLAGDTLITRTDTGEQVPIKNLVGQINIPVHTLDDDWKIKEARISKVFSSGKKMIYELKTRNGFMIKASANHPFRKLDDWYRLDQLKSGDYIATISPHSTRNTERLQSFTNRHTEKSSLALLPSQTIENLIKLEVLWDEIVSLTPLGVEEVYDATVPGTHNFVANDIVVHNSLEQDSDVVMFIYREDRYRQETTRKNICDIIIAKHRNGPIGKVELFFDEQRVCFRNLQKEEYAE